MGHPNQAGLETEKLHIQNTADKERPHSIPVANVSKKFDGLLVQWWRHFGLKGNGLIIGDGGHCDVVKSTLKANFPEIESVKVADIKDADIIWDICTPAPFIANNFYNWVICQAVLEHIIDPFCAIRNMIAVIKPGGLLYLHTVGPNMKVHRHPIDCMRFLRDFFVIAEERLPITIMDILATMYHVNVVYKRLV